MHKNRTKMLFIATIIYAAFALNCGFFEKKKTKIPPDDLNNDLKVPESWDGLTDWKGSTWEVK